jgi:hypothetical protein
MSPAADAVLQRLDGLRQKWWLFTLLTTAIWALATSLALLLIFMLGDALLMLSQWILIGMSVVWLLVTGGMVFLVGRRLVQGHRGLEGAARRVEYECPELGSSLINIVQLATDTANENRAFCDAAINEAAARVEHFRFDQAASRETRWRRFRYCMQTPRDLVESLGMLGMVIAMAVACQSFVPNWGSAANRLMSPWEFIPSIGSVGEIKVTPGNAEVLIGSTLEITAEIKNPQAKEYRATIFVAKESERKEEPLTMSADEHHRQFKIALPSLVDSLRYRIQIGNSQTPRFAVVARPKPTFTDVEVSFLYPAYLGKNRETIVQKTADLEAPLGTEAELRIRPSVPVGKVYIQIEGQRIVGSVEDAGNLAVVKVPMFKDAAFTVNLITPAGHGDPDPRLNHIRVDPDKPPAAELLKPSLQSSVAPGGDVAVVIKATDDHAVARVRLEMKVEHPAAGGEIAAEKPAAAEEQPATTVQDWEKFEGTTNVLLNYRLTLPADKVKAGDVVKIRAVAWDKRLITDWGLNLRPQESASQWHSIRVIAEEAKLSAALEELDNLRGSVWKILESQLRTRVKTADILHRPQASERISTAGDVRAEQLGIQKSAIAVVASIKDADKEERLAIKRALNGLAVGEMIDAVHKCDELVKLKAAEDFDKPVPPLGEVQDKIIDVLRRMLNETRKAQAEVLSETPKRLANNMPDDVKQKLEETKKKVDEFLKQEKKIIEATDNLAKKPVEDFTDKDEEALKGLAARQDDWAKMMSDLHSDLSKLPEQDFANASMAKELNEVQTELKMAEDAMLKKSADIAVPLEQLGYENAKELSSNIEKWLPDTPDREKWSQEEALQDENKEAPMAELPTELEDLIGELAEEEEDLMAEADDVSSSAIDSADKGVGWDASDGPISDNSAKGVTGNRLPNTSEIGGRSGEGRSGKSSGEFVGDEAVGKGGRKTPARLTPDPYVKGQIKDHEKDGGGGATGGGKESGQGGEGLEGNAPRARFRDLARLAGKQAALREKAVGVDLQFQVHGYHHTDMEKLIELMSQIQLDLASGRYQNALRQRQVLAGGLENIKQYLKGEFEVRQDATTNLPADIQKQLLGAMQDLSPAGWEEINQDYFRRLSGDGSDANGTLDAAKSAAKPAPSK